MKRIILIIVGAVLLVGIAGFFQFGPGMVERGMNQIDGEPLIEVSDEAKALHKTLTIVDLHSDTLLWSRNLLTRANRGHMDLPRLEEGNVALQVFSSVTKTPKGQNYDSNDADSDNITTLAIAQLQPTRTWNSLLERSLWHAEKLDRAAAKSDGELVEVTSAEEIDQLLAVRADKSRWPVLKPKYNTPLRGQPPVGALLSIEGLQNLEGDLSNLDVLRTQGFRMASLTHFFDTDLAGSMHGLEKGGLTDKGRSGWKSSAW